MVANGAAMVPGFVSLPVGATKYSAACAPAPASITPESTAANSPVAWGERTGDFRGDVAIFDQTFDQTFDRSSDRFSVFLITVLPNWA